MIVSSDGRIFSASSDQAVKIWDANTGSCLKTFTGHKNVSFACDRRGDALQRIYHVLSM